MTTTLSSNEDVTPSAVAPHFSGAGSVANYGKMKVLIIDDEPANVALLEGMLSDNGYTRVSSLTDSRLALETYATFQPDLVLLDLMMPHVDGLTILEALRAQTADVFLPVLVLTADINEKTKIRALQTGATDFLLKPFDYVEVLLRIANLLEIRWLHTQLDTQRAAFEDALRARTSELRDANVALGKKSWSGN
ncbi:MAG: two-component system, NtrC family, sensor kinase [Verrucomicrobiota bacterium]|jgi:putative two-component system response regulator